MQVIFLPTNQKQETESGENLLDVALRAGLMPDVSCGGRGTCGKCKVRILKGKCKAPDSAEREVLSASELSLGFRLACRLSVEDSLLVYVPKTAMIQSGKTKLQSLPADFNKEISIAKYYVRVQAATLDNQKSDMDRILIALSRESAGINPGEPASLSLGERYRLKSELLSQIPGVLAEGTDGITLTTRNQDIIALETGDTRADSYGIAFDIGTTTVVGMLWDLNNGVMMGAFAKTNPQNAYGADVISRIQAASGNPEALNVMQTKIRDCLNEIISDFKRTFAISSRHIYEVTVVCNTTMSHLFLGIDPSSLAHSPFVPVFCAAWDFSGQALKLDISELANVHLLPNIAGHVGSDIVGVLLATGIIRKKGLHLAIDIGTNGEIVLAKDGHVLVCSTAAGPAFEGAHIKCGMRASGGAIERVSIEHGEVHLEIIEDQKPTGICGSGLIDAVAQLLDAGLIDQTGRLMDQAGALKNNQPQSLAGRLRDGEKGREFVLYVGKDSEDIVITQKDIREVQLAKGAIASGIVIMLGILGAKTAELESISLAGAFGNYIRKESALRIGLFPDMPMDKILSVGNAAGTGACMALLSMTERLIASQEALQAIHIELAGCQDFQTEFINAMSFPKSGGDKIE